jgi:hypothetical protein
MRRNNVIIQPSAMPFINQQPEYVQDLSQIFADQNARNQQANTVNTILNERQLTGRTPLDDWRDKRIAEIQAQKANPIYQQEQNIVQAQDLAKAISGTKQLDTMSYKGNTVAPGSDGKFYLPNNEEVTDVNNIEKNYKYDHIAGALEAAKKGNPLAIKLLQDQMKPKQGMDLPDRLALVQAQVNAKAEINALKSKKDNDLKPKDINQFLTALGIQDYNDNDRNVITSVAYEASDDPKKLSALSSALTANSNHNITPFMAKRWLSQDNFSKAMQAFQNQ